MRLLLTFAIISAITVAATDVENPYIVSRPAKQKLANSVLRPVYNVCSDDNFAPRSVGISIEDRIIANADLQTQVLYVFVA